MISFFLLGYPCFEWQGDLWKFLKPREINLAKTVPPIERATTKDMPLAECETCRALRRFKGRLCKWWEFKNHKPPPALKTQNAICFTGSTLVRNVSQTVNKIHSWMLEVKV